MTDRSGTHIIIDLDIMPGEGTRRSGGTPGNPVEGGTRKNGRQGNRTRWERIPFAILLHRPFHSCERAKPSAMHAPGDECARLCGSPFKY